MKKTALFILLLIVLASLPIGFLGHEIWHLIFSYFYGGKPIALCVNFDKRIFASALIDTSNVSMTPCEQCKISMFGEAVAYIITVGILLLMIYIFTKKYQDLSNKELKL